MLGTALVSRTARADASFALAWRVGPGAAGCVTEPALREGVAKKLRRDPFVARDRADIVIEGEEVFSGGRFRARLIQRDRSGAVLGSRELDAESCASLLRTTTVVVALFIEPYKDREPEERGPTGAGPVDAKPPEAGRPAKDAAEQHTQGTGSATLPREPPKAPAASPRAPFELSLGIGGAAAVGLLPSLSAELLGVARLNHTGSRWSFEWHGGYAFPQTVIDGRVRGTFYAIDQQLRACLALVARSELTFDACGGGFWGAIKPTTSGVHDGNDTWRPIGGPVGALAVGLRQHQAAARFELGLVPLPVRRSLYYLTSEAEPARFYSTGRVIVFFGLSGLVTIL